MSETCNRCCEKLDPNSYVAAEGKVFRPDCFKCDHCFDDFPDGQYFYHQEKFYCKDCYEMLYAPICAGCSCILEDTYIIAMGRKWHPDCLICSTCRKPLTDSGAGFKQTPDGRILCSTHYELELKKGFDKEICQICFKIVYKDELLRHKGEAYHAYHFNCVSCKCELDFTAKEINGELYCLPCHDNHESIHICNACHTPIEGRRIFALNAYWHGFVSERKF